MCAASRCFDGRGGHRRTQSPDRSGQWWCHRPAGARGASIAANTQPAESADVLGRVPGAAWDGCRWAAWWCCVVGCRLWTSVTLAAPCLDAVNCETCRRAAFMPNSAFTCYRIILIDGLAETHAPIPGLNPLRPEPEPG